MQQPGNPQAQALLQSLMGGQAPQPQAPQAPMMSPQPTGPIPPGSMNRGQAPLTQSNFGQLMGLGRKSPSVEELLFKAQQNGGK